MAQNTSHAVMAQRTEKRDSLDDFPTPPWATRALLRHVLIPTAVFRDRVLEPACGRGHMAHTLGEYFRKVDAFDIKDYGYKRQLKPRDFLKFGVVGKTYDWIITNPPFNLAEEFVTCGLEISDKGTAMFVRSTFAESVGRYNRLFKTRPPAIVAQFSERVVLHKGKLVEKGSTATAYCWMVWDRLGASSTKFTWIPPCRAQLERPEDYKSVRGTTRHVARR